MGWQPAQGQSSHIAGKPIGPHALMAHTPTSGTPPSPRHFADDRSRVYFRPIVAGALSYLPIRRRYKGTGGTDSARYCYGSWLTMLRMLDEAGLPTEFESLVELGPGDTIGIGIAAVLTGANKYFALDVLDHADVAGNLRVFDELIPMLRSHAAAPDHVEFPRMHPRLPDYRFPDALIPDTRLAAALQPERLACLRRALESRAQHASSSIEIKYVVPWKTQPIAAPGAVDLVFSQVALQDVPAGELAQTHETIAKWLRPGGVVYHHIDLSYPQVSSRWNEHWVYPKAVWRVVVGRRPYYFNRVPLSEHLAMIERAGFRVANALVKRNTEGCGRSEVAAAFRGLPDEDFVAEAVTVVAERR
jgi:hypothetical protein